MRKFILRLGIACFGAALLLLVLLGHGQPSWILVLVLLFLGIIFVIIGDD
jgi:hypothetical protein